MKITLRFYESGTLSSRLIELTGKYSHVDAIVEPPAPPPGTTFGLGLAEAKLEGQRIDYDRYQRKFYGARSDRVGGKPSGVQLRSNYGEQPYDDLCLEVTQDQHDRFWNFLWRQDGKPYDYEAIFAFAIERDWHDPGHWFCSELIAGGLEAALVFAKSDIPVNKVPPGMLAFAFQAVGAVKV